MANDFKKGVALGLVLMWFLAGVVAKTGGLAMWIVLAVAAYLAFFSK